MDQRTEMPPCSLCGEARMPRWNVDGTVAFLCSGCLAGIAMDSARIARRLAQIRDLVLDPEG
jgi:hypothetical protein